MNNNNGLSKHTLIIDYILFFPSLKFFLQTGKVGPIIKKTPGYNEKIKRFDFHAN
jgi:hypothetical protein